MTAPASLLIVHQGAFGDLVCIFPEGHSDPHLRRFRSDMERIVEAIRSFLGMEEA